MVPPVAGVAGGGNNHNKFEYLMDGDMKYGGKDAEDHFASGMGVNAVAPVSVRSLGVLARVAMPAPPVACAAANLRRETQRSGVNHNDFVKYGGKDAEDHFKNGTNIATPIEPSRMYAGGGAVHGRNAQKNRSAMAHGHFGQGMAVRDEAKRAPGFVPEPSPRFGRRAHAEQALAEAQIALRQAVPDTPDEVRGLTVRLQVIYEWLAAAAKMAGWPLYPLYPWWLRTRLSSLSRTWKSWCRWM